MNEAVSPADANRITAYLDAEAPPREPTAHIVFDTNQTRPAELVARRYHDGLAPLIILTGGVNRSTGVVEAIGHRRILVSTESPKRSSVRRTRP